MSRFSIRFGWRALGPILKLLFALLVLMVTLHFALGDRLSREALLGCFCLLSLAIAVSWSRLADKPEGDLVDLFYYLLAALGVVLFFYSNTLEREKSERAKHHNDAKIAYERFLNDSKEVKALAPNPEVFFESIKEYARRRLPAERTAEEVDECLRFQREFESQLESGRLREKLRSRDSIPPRLLEESLINPQLCLQEHEPDVSLRGMIASQSPGQMLGYVNDGNARELQRALGLSASRLPLRRVLEMLSMAWPFPRDYTQVDANLLRLQEDRDKAWERVEELNKVQGFSISISIREFYWPYILILAFCLKIARRDYILDGRKSVVN